MENLIVTGEFGRKPTLEFTDPPPAMSCSSRSSMRATARSSKLETPSTATTWGKSGMETSSIIPTTAALR